MPGYRHAEEGVTATLLPSHISQSFETVIKSAQEHSQCTSLDSGPPCTLLCYALKDALTLWSSPTLLALISRSPKEHAYLPHSCTTFPHIVLIISASHTSYHIPFPTPVLLPQPCSYSLGPTGLCHVCMEHSRASTRALQRSKGC